MIVRKIVISFCNNIRHFSNEINKRGGGIFFCGGWNFSKSVSVDSTFIREMRVYNQSEVQILDSNSHYSYDILELKVKTSGCFYVFSV